MKVFGKKKDKIVFYVLVCSLGLAGVLSFVTFACAPVGFEEQALMDQASSENLASVPTSPIEESNPVGAADVTPLVSPVSSPSSTTSPLVSVPTPTPTRVITSIPTPTPTPARVSTPTPTPAPTRAPTPTPTPRPAPCTDIAISSQQFYFPARGSSIQVLQVRGIPLGCYATYTCFSPGENFVTITSAGYTPDPRYNHLEYSPLSNPPKIDWFNFDWASNSRIKCSLNVDINMSVDDNPGGPRSLPLEVRGRLGTAQFLKTMVIYQEGI